MSQEELKKALKEIIHKHREIEGLSIVSSEGLPVVSLLPQEIDEIVISAITATLISVGEKANLQLNKGFLQRVILEGDNGYIVITSIDENTLL
ncbi:MAG: roadblock/LC7 domain-containing protein, partial [Candidatus Baldrarchaeota archaeon]